MLGNLVALVTQVLGLPNRCASHGCEGGGTPRFSVVVVSYSKRIQAFMDMSFLQ